MLTIRDQQIEALVDAHRSRFVADAVEALSARWPELAARLGAGFADAVRAAVERSERYGIDEPEHIEAFLDVMGALGDPDFDRNRPWAAAILGDRRYDGPLKCSELAEGAARELAPRDPDDNPDESAEDR